MHINRLRLVGFKSFVEATELIVERGLTGVVGPNGCGKSNLLEALRWVMGETSHKSMRAASMDDVIFSGTTSRPARNAAEVTIFIDNAKRLAPAGFNDSDLIEITRRIEREEGSSYRINGREARARDIKILFEDAATGARSPALVRQGQISEIVNAKPEQRRRILEDAAGVAGLHTRRHEAELRLRAAEGNLARIGDILGQIGSQVESLKRQARQAKRYKELSEDIRRAEALVAHLAWSEAQAEVAAMERSLEDALVKLGLAVESEGRATTAESRLAEGLPSLREEEAKRSAILARLRIERDNFERDVQRAADRVAELEGRIAQLEADRMREEAAAEEARETLARLESEADALASRDDGGEADHELKERLAAAEQALQVAEAALKAITARAFETEARRRSLAASLAERRQQAERLMRQSRQAEAQLAEITARTPDSHRHHEAQADLERLVAEVGGLETEAPEAEAAARQARERLVERRKQLETARLELGTLKAERDTLARMLRPAGGNGWPPVVDQVEVEPGFESALAAALGDDLDAGIAAEAPMHWRLVQTTKPDPTLPTGLVPLGDKVKAPQELARRLAQIGIVPRDQGAMMQAALRPGQRLVSVEGDLWRWDGFVAAADAPSAAAQRLAGRNRLTQIERRVRTLESKAEQAAALEREAVDELSRAETQERILRQRWRESQTELAKARDVLSGLERAAREIEARLGQISTVKSEVDATLADSLDKVSEAELELAELDIGDDLSPDIQVAEVRVGTAREDLDRLRAEDAARKREQQIARQRADALAADIARSRSRAANAEQHIETLGKRLAQTQNELADSAVDPEALADKRQRLMDAVALAERERQEAGDALAQTESALREASTALKAAQASVVTEREARARLEARLDNARTRRSEEARRIRETLGVAPEGCLAVAGVAEGEDLPALVDVDRQLIRLKADRERLGGVNLQAAEELEALQGQFDNLDKERADVEDAIAKLRGGIAQLNREGKRRLMEAFQTVDSHFQRLFTTLFGGGEARLEMIEGEDPLEGGLEIIAKPPGKKPATLSLLSGGEQTLTALSLIFAVFLTNPSPICVLDEVDAPLDDANVDRFCTLMERMAQETETRFLVITHHPMTMARMDRLFGVTMAERGVSQLVSVDLATAERYREAV
jgi:chromosome segregation protein